MSLELKHLKDFDQKTKPTVLFFAKLLTDVQLVSMKLL